MSMKPVSAGNGAECEFTAGFRKTRRGEGIRRGFIAKSLKDSERREEAKESGGALSRRNIIMEEQMTNKYQADEKEKSLLKFITCGSVDDGKSTLIGHMLYDAKLIFADQKRSLEIESKVGSAGGKLDYSLLLDGLMAEREQGITIDVAYRYFSTRKRSFIVADTPGHEEYTRNMAVGASFAELALILIDATKGVLVQTRRHARICMLMGIRNFVFAVNKMDLVGYDEETYHKIADQIRDLMGEYELDSLAIIPVSASEGDNLNYDKGALSWYEGESLLEYLENIEITPKQENEGFCLPVQRVCRPDRFFRGFQGEICRGAVRTGDKIMTLPSGQEARVSKILIAGEETDEASAGDPVTICLDREIDVSRGCVLVKDYRPVVGSKFAATVLWMDDEPLAIGKPYIGQVGVRNFQVTVTAIDYSIDVNTGEHVPAKQAGKNMLTRCRLSADSSFVFDRFTNTKELGELILIDRVTHATAGCGVIEYSLENEGKVLRQNFSLTRADREARNAHKAITFWFTGLSGSGKSGLANELEKRFFRSGFHTIILDGDNVRMGLNRGLGFSVADRMENIRRTAEAARLLNDAGVIVLCSFISPYHEDRKMARRIIGDAFVEVYVSTPIEECERRDVKGLYAKARRGEIRDFTGISSPYEPPRNPEIEINTMGKTSAESADLVIDRMLSYL